MGARREHHASDIYPAWKKAITDANDSVVVFTPYFDALIVRLVAHAAVDVTVVTDLSPESGAQDYLGQLRAIKKLLDDGIEVRHLDRLHAKVLWVDDGTVVYGSQNFTRYARKSKEASTSPAIDLTGAPFVDTLAAWLNESARIEAALVEELVAAAKRPAERVKVAQRDLASVVQATMTEHQRSKRGQVTFNPERLRRATDRSHSRLAQGTARLRMTNTGNYYNWYPTLMADSRTDLTRWRVSTGASIDTIKLDSLYQYPLIEQESGRMTWARIGSTRITYVHQGVQHGNYLTTTEYNRVQVTTRFPSAPQIVHHNIEWIFTPIVFGYTMQRDSVMIRTLFDGETLTVVREPVTDPNLMTPNFVEDCLAVFQPQKIGGFLEDYFTKFRYGPGHLNRDSHNVRDFFDGSEYYMHLVQLHHVPVLVAEKIY